MTAIVNEEMLNLEQKKFDTQMIMRITMCML